MFKLVSWLENHLMTCYYKQLSGFDCPGCGMQRSFLELLKGNLIKSFYLYPALLPVIYTLLFTSAHLVFKFKNGATNIKYSFIITILVVITNYIVKIVQ